MKKEKMTFGQYAILFSCIGEEERAAQYEAMKALPPFAEVCGKEVPKNLNLISYGQLDDLHDKSEGAAAIANCCRVILGATDEEILNERAERVLWFVKFCNDEVGRINKLFDTLTPSYDPEERQAGIERLKFGSFGILDWYAKRMGIADQDKVRDVPWVRIFQCMKNDNEMAQYEKRLREVYKRKGNTKKK